MGVFVARIETTVRAVARRVDAIRNHAASYGRVPSDVILRDAAPPTAVVARLDRRSSTPRLLDLSLPSLEYWVARSSRAMTVVCGAVRAGEKPQVRRWRVTLFGLIGLRLCGFLGARGHPGIIF